MSETGKFMIFCIEQYRAAKGLDGKTVMELFVKYSVLDYISNSFGALHTTGTKYIINDIDEFIKTRAA